MAFYTQQELGMLNFKYLGRDVLISNKASIYGAQYIEIDDHSRIDDFCVLSAGSGGIRIGKYVHVACFCSLIGKEKIVLEDFSGLSSRVSIYSSSDDYSGMFLTNPTVPKDFTNVQNGAVTLKKHVIIGVGAAVLPTVTIEIGSAVAAFSLVTKSIEEFSIYGGVPAKRLKARKKDMIQLENQLFNLS